MKVSIICTNFNKGDWLADAIESFLAQKTTFSYEIILVDDASVDQSPKIIRKYVEQYPNKIRAFFHETNQGIAKTWIEICNEARGEYIARCDGDDYWTDPYKLQKQVELLETTTDSQWSNTEFDMVDSQGNVTQPNVFNRGVIPLITSYEDMLALKGMTMASTWLVDAHLMREVNGIIDPNATDDTYNIQLELFKRTKLSFLPDSTTVYRMVNNSDSRPDSEEKTFKRIDGLLLTQLSYLSSTPLQSMSKVAECLLKHDAEQEKRLFKLNRDISQLHQENHETHKLLHQEVTSSLKAHKALEEMVVQNDQLSREKEYWKEQYELVIHSRRWTIPTKIINLFRRKK